jgi:hypothetical protein
VRQVYGVSSWADEGIKRCDGLSPGYRDRVELRGGMSDLGGVARLLEDLEDVHRRSHRGLV